MNKKTNHYTLMFFPEDNGKPFTLRVHKNIVRSLLVFFFVFICFLVMLLFKSGEIAAKLQMLYIVKLEKDKLELENKQLREISSKFYKIEELYTYLNKLANPPVYSVSKVTIDSAKNSDIPVQSSNTINFSQNIPTSVVKDNIHSIPNILPVDGWITRSFSKDIDSSQHKGIDFAATLGSSIKATAPGFIEEIKNDSYLGLLITINHENGFKTKYGHCSQVFVNEHNYIKRGQTIALVGNTGRSTAPHLHYELIKDGVNIDPMKLLLISK
jgi:murein DD-endopeptidase MepM/ murein hydrolase activator NlpD